MDAELESWRRQWQADRRSRIDDVAVAVQRDTTFLHRMIRKGGGAPTSCDHAAYIEMSIRRCRSVLTALTLACFLCLLELGLCVMWNFHRAAPAGDVLSSPVAIAVLAFSIAPGMIALWAWGNKKQELSNLLRMYPDLGTVAAVGEARLNNALSGKRWRKGVQRRTM